jgi:hypothetical protein
MILNIRVQATDDEIGGHCDVRLLALNRQRRRCGFDVVEKHDGLLTTVVKDLTSSAGIIEHTRNKAKD